MVKHFKKIAHRSQFFPTALTGLALGLCGIAAVVDVNIKTFDPAWKWWISIGLIGIASVLFMFSFIKMVAHPKVLKYELSDPLLCSFLPTFTMTLMCIGGFIAGWQHISFLKNSHVVAPAQVIGAILMLAAVIGQFILMFFFVRDILLKHKWHEDEMYGSWFVPTVGLATASTMAQRFNQNILPNQFFQFIWYFAFISYLLLFLPITYSLLFHSKKNNVESFPSIAVYFAPAGLTSASFFETFNVPYAMSIAKWNTSGLLVFCNHTQFINFYPFAYINTMSIILTAFAFVYAFLLWFVFLIRIIQIRFSFIFASLTFPVAINAASMTFVALYLRELYTKATFHSLLLFDLMWTFRIIGYLFAFGALILILIIMVKFLFNLHSLVYSQKNDDKKHQVYLKQEIERAKTISQIIITQEF